MKNNVYLIALVAGLVCMAVYLPTLNCDFVNLDDPQYVIENTGIRSMGGDFWVWAFGFPLNYWAPLLMVSFAIDYQIWGLNPLGYHLTNIILHALNAGLIVLVADVVYAHRFDRYNGEAIHSKYIYPVMLLLAGMLFGIHPARVESVAWITERKDVLNGLFSLGAIYCYLRYQETHENTAIKPWRCREYFLSLGLFLLSLMAKPSSMFLPMALLVIDWYPLGRIRKGKMLAVIVEKLPFILIAGIIASLSVFLRAQQGGFNSISEFPFAVRAVASGNSLVEYFKLMVFPVGILPFHALPRGVPIIYIYKAIAAVLLLCSSVFIGKKLPWCTAILFFFTITIFPSLHFFADGYQLILAARYTYLPSIFPSIIVAAMVALLYLKARSWNRLGGNALIAVVISVLVFYAVTTVQLIGDWKNSGTLWTKVIAYQPFDKAYFFRGKYYADNGEYLPAIEDYTTCLAQASKLTIPPIYNIYAFRGEALTRAGFYAEAAADFTTAISMYPHPLYYYHRSLALKGLGKFREANADIRSAGNENGPIQWYE